MGEWDNEIQCNKCDRYRPSTQATCPGMFNTWRDGRITAVLCSGNEHLQKIRRRLAHKPSAEFQEAMQTFYDRHGRQMNTADLIAKLGNLSQFLAAQYLLWNRSADEEIFSAMGQFYEEEGRYMEPDELVAASQNLTKTLSTVSAAKYIIHQRRPG